MRLLMLSQSYPPYIGGEERFVQDLSRGLARRGHEVAVATLWQEGMSPFDRDDNIRVYRIKGTIRRARWLFREATRMHAPPVPDPELLLALRHVVAREHPQIVHAHNWLVHSFVPLKRWSGAKLVLSLHDYSLACAKKKLIYYDHYEAPCSGPGLAKCLGCCMDHYGPGKGVATVLGNWSMGAAEKHAIDMFLPVSHATAAGNGLAGLGLPFHVAPNMVAADAQVLNQDVDEYLAQLPDSGFLLYVGAFGAYKGLDVLFEAYAGLRDAPPLVLIGYHTAEYPVATRELPPNVLQLMDWPHAAVMEAWRRSSIALVPSLVAETFGIVALEAMLMGRPVIASRIGGLPEVIVDGETGLLVSPGDPLALRNAIELLLANDELRERMGGKGQLRADLFAARNVVPRFESIYQSLLDADSQA